MASAINVLHILNSAHGGSALSTFQLIEELTKLGVSSSLVCFNNADEKQAKQISDLVEGRILFIPLYWTNQRIRVKWWKRPLLELYTSLKTFRGHRFQKEIDGFIKKNRINIIHTSTLVNPEGAIAAKRNSLPHVWHARELVGPKTYYHFANYKKWSLYISTNSNVLIANSSITRANLLNYFTEDKIVIVSNGIDITSFQKKKHLQVVPRIVGMVGNVTSRVKNHKFFIKTAFSFLNKIDTEVEFRIYGALPEKNEPYFQSLNEMISKLGLDKVVKFEGHKAPAEIMKEIDVLFHPTGLESFGRIFIEAMAGGIPIVAANEGGAKELVKPELNGYLVNENNVAEAAEKISVLLRSSDLRNAMGAEGRKRVEEKYTLSLTAEKILSIYRNQLHIH